jgi:hypothetical protein
MFRKTPILVPHHRTPSISGFGKDGCLFKGIAPGEEDIKLSLKMSGGVSGLQ